MVDRRRRFSFFVALQLAIPAGLLLNRLSTGEIDWYGWGWQMFS